jgi:histidyl-tRNA synthetase
VAAETGYSGNAKKRLERANKSGAAFAVLVGADIKLKNLKDGAQQDVTLADLPNLLRV